MPTIRFTKSGPVDRYQDAWSGAKPFDLAPKYLQRASAGTTFLIGFDRDREDPIFWSQTALSLTRSGTPDRPISIDAGFIAHPGAVQPARVPSRAVFFRQSGAPWAGRTAPNTDGKPFLTLKDGASHQRLTGFTLVGAPASGFVRFVENGDPYSDIFIQGISATQVGRVIETASDTHVTNLIVQDCDAFEIVRGFARFRSITDSTFRNLYLDAAGVDGGGTRVCQLIAITSGKNLLFENITMKNAVNALNAEERGSDYVQGDGIVCERETSDVTFRNCRSEGMGDGGFDIKASGFLMENCSSYQCKYGLRVWQQSENTVRNCSFENPRSIADVKGACLWVSGYIDIVDSQLQAGPGTSVFRFWDHADGGEPRIRIFGGAIRMDGDAVLAEGNGSIELNDVTINGELRNGIHNSSDGWSFLKNIVR